MSPDRAPPATSRPAYFAAFAVGPLRDSSGSSAPATEEMSATSGLTGSCWLPGVIHRQPFSVSAIEGDPGSDERGRLGDDAEGVLVVSLPPAARPLQRRALQREDVPPDQRGDHVQIRGWSMTRSWISRRRWSMWIPQQMLEARVGVLLFAAEPATPADLRSAVSRVVSSLSRAWAWTRSDAMATMCRDVVCN